MSQFNHNVKYSRLHAELSKFQSSQIVNRLLQQITLNQDKSLQILKLENRIIQLESQLKNTLASSYMTTKSRMKQMSRSASNVTLSNSSSNLYAKSDIKSSKWSTKIKQLSEQTSLFAQQNTQLRQQFKDKNHKLLIQLKQSNQNNQKLTQQNQILTNKLQETLNDINTLSQSYESMDRDIVKYKNNSTKLLQQNNELLTNNTNMTQEFQRSVNIIQNLFKQIQQIQSQSNQKTVLLKQMNQRTSYLDIHLKHSLKQIQKYESAMKQLSTNQVKYSQQINKLSFMKQDNQMLIDKFQKQIMKMRQLLDNQKNNNYNLESQIKQLKNRYTSSESQINIMKQSQIAISKLLQQKETEIEQLKRNQRDRITQLRVKISQLQKQNEQIKEDFVLNNKQFQQQFQNQQKLIDDYEKALRQPLKPTQLNVMKEIIRGQKCKQFKLNNFKIKIQSENIEPQNQQQGYFQMPEYSRRETSGRYLKTRRQINDKMSDKTTDFTERTGRI